MNLRLTSIQRFSTYDGPGIRTTLFLKGCQIRCPWCANPENLNYEIQPYVSENGTPMTFGKDYEIQDVLEICLRDKDYYSDEGGITASGGEALLQYEALGELFKRLKDNGISCGIETSLYAPKRAVEVVAPYLDFAYVDIKILDKKRAKYYLNADIDVYQSNVDYFFDRVGNKKITTRIPIVPGITDDENCVNSCMEFLAEYKPAKCEIFSVHNLGKAKYRSLCLPYTEFKKADSDMLEQIRDRLLISGVPVSINI